MTMKIIIDTNVLLSALLSRHGASNKLLIWLFEQKQKYNVISNTLVIEYTDALMREKHMKNYNNTNPH